MKKILHISKYYYPFSGGTEQIARDVVLALKGEYEQKVMLRLLGGSRMVI